MFNLLIASSSIKNGLMIKFFLQLICCTKPGPSLCMMHWFLFVIMLFSVLRCCCCCFYVFCYAHFFLLINTLQLNKYTKKNGKTRKIDTFNWLKKTVNLVVVQQNAVFSYWMHDRSTNISQRYTYVGFSSPSWVDLHPTHLKNHARSMYDFQRIYSAGVIELNALHGFISHGLKSWRETSR